MIGVPPMRDPVLQLRRLAAMRLLFGDALRLQLP